MKQKFRRSVVEILDYRHATKTDGYKLEVRNAVIYAEVSFSF